MAERNNVLSNHKLTHLVKLGVNENIFRGRFPGACATSRCNANCCKAGVWTDLLERDRILQNADLIRNHTDPDQEQNPERWFGPASLEDTDFPSGWAASTQMINDACVFLNNAHRCVLQNASRDQITELKPFFCAAFPITIDKGQLKIDDRQDGHNLDCCTLTADGKLDVFDVCVAELKHVLGEEGLKELERLARAGPDAMRLTATRTMKR
jgi:Fe-S-cluster containining protein